MALAVAATKTGAVFSCIQVRKDPSTRDAGPPSTLNPCVEMPASISSIQRTQGAAASAVRNALRRLVSGEPKVPSYTAAMSRRISGRCQWAAMAFTKSDLPQPATPIISTPFGMRFPEVMASRPNAFSRRVIQCLRFSIPPTFSGPVSFTTNSMMPLRPTSCRLLSKSAWTISSPRDSRERPRARTARSISTRSSPWAASTSLSSSPGSPAQILDRCAFRPAACSRKERISGTLGSPWRKTVRSSRRACGVCSSWPSTTRVLPPPRAAKVLSFRTIKGLSCQKAARSFIRKSAGPGWARAKSSAASASCVSGTAVSPRRKPSVQFQTYIVPAPFTWAAALATIPSV